MQKSTKYNMPPKRAASSNVMLYSRNWRIMTLMIQNKVISPAKMDSVKISKELHSGVCNHGQATCKFPHTAREGEPLQRGGKEVERATVNKNFSQ